MTFEGKRESFADYLNRRKRERAATKEAAHQLGADQGVLMSSSSESGQPADLPKYLPVGTKIRVGRTIYTAVTTAKLTDYARYMSDWKCEDDGEITRQSTAIPASVIWDELPEFRCRFCGDRFASRPEFDGTPINGAHTMCQNVLDARAAVVAAAAKMANCDNCGAPFRKEDQGNSSRCIYCVLRC
jgi:hypothetical protein